MRKLVEEKIRIPVIILGRIAGQYAKPRTVPKETINGRTVFAYHGDLINSETCIDERNPNPNRLLEGYLSSKKVLQHLSALNEKIFTSHECFLLEYEKHLTRIVNNIRYSASTHLPWIGMRNMTSFQHIDYLSKVANPVGIKVDATMRISTLRTVIKKINSNNTPGKLIIITRLGARRINTALPRIIKLIVYFRQLSVN